MPDPFNPAPIPSFWVEQILASEHDHRRFELFANAVGSALEGRPIMATSASWDLGRDGRAGAGTGVYVITTLEDGIQKPSDDAKRLKKTTTKIKRVYYVTACPHSDHTLDAHARVIGAELGVDVDVEPIGGIQIADLVSSGKVADAFRKAYAGELGGIQATFSGSAEGETALQQLELALSTFGAADTQQLRDALISRLVLTLLEPGPATIEELAASAGRWLGVDAFSASTIKGYCRDLAESGLVTTQGDSHYQVSESGTVQLARSRRDLVVTELKGRAAVRGAVEESLGGTLTEQQWSAIWTALQRELARAFYLRGKQLLELFSALLEGDTSTVHRDAMAPLIEDVLGRVVERHVTAPQRPIVLRALQDAFLPGDKHGAFEWLAEVASRFAAICTLGLPQEIIAGLRAALGSIRYFLDTDVVISYLCPHEPAHDAAKSVMELSQKLGQQVMVTDAVAEETARHAAKAHTDYKVRVTPVTRSLAWYEVADLESAFTREFEYLRLERRVKPRQWTAFIERYTGPENRDRTGKLLPNVGRMRQILSKDSFAIRSPGEQDQRWEKQRDALAARMYEEAKRLGERDLEMMQHKARIDAEMLMAVARTMQEAESGGKGERFILVSSARRLRHLSSGIRRQLPDVPEVVSLPEAACLASFLPERPVSLKALHGLLFEGHFAGSLGGLEAMLLRIVREAASTVVPGATRGVLVQEFSDAILREAKKTGETRGEVRARIEANPVAFATIAATALEALALQKPSDREEVLRKLEAVAKAKPSTGGP
jgi:predicted nucleic acid-binding protein